MVDQAVVQQQVGGIGERQQAVGRWGGDQHLAQALQGAAAVAFGPPEQSRLVVELPAGDGGLRSHVKGC